VSVTDPAASPTPPSSAPSAPGAPGAPATQPTAKAVGSERTPVIFAAVEVFLFVLAPVLFFATGIGAPSEVDIHTLKESGGIGPALGVLYTFGPVAPFLLTAGIFAIVTSRRIIRANRTANVETRKSVRVASTVAFVLTLVAGIPAVLGIIVVVFLMIALSGYQPD
jgi:hypothetical protein